VREVYGQSPVRVVLDVSPEISGENHYAEPTTTAVDLDDLRPADSAA
jgi:hypothetical protein